MPLPSCVIFGIAISLAVFVPGVEAQTVEPVLHYRKVEMRGELHFRARDEASGHFESFNVMLYIRSDVFGGNKSYELQLPEDKQLRETARKLEGKVVVITGEMITIVDRVQTAMRPYPPRDAVQVKTLKAADQPK